MSISAPVVPEAALGYLERLGKKYRNALVFSTSPTTDWWLQHYERVAEITIGGRFASTDRSHVQTLHPFDYAESANAHLLRATISKAIAWLGAEPSVVFVSGRRRVSCAVSASAMLPEATICLANSNRPRYLSLHMLLRNAAEQRSYCKEPDSRGERGVWEFTSWEKPDLYYRQNNFSELFVYQLAFHTGRFAEVLAMLNWHDPDNALRTGVEVGVYRGDHADQILLHNPEVRLTAVDMFDLHAERKNTAYTTQATDKTARRMGDQQHATEAYQSTVSKLQRYGSRAKVLKASSEEAVSQFSNLDFAYIDGDHSYGGCLADLQRWWEVIRPGGILAGHDFGVPRFGVSDAVNAFASKMQLIAVTNAASHGEWLIRKPYC